MSTSVRSGCTGVVQALLLEAAEIHWSTDRAARPAVARGGDLRRSNMSRPSSTG